MLLKRTLHTAEYVIYTRDVPKPQMRQIILPTHLLLTDHVIKSAIKDDMIQTGSIHLLQATDEEMAVNQIVLDYVVFPTTYTVQ